MEKIPWTGRHFVVWGLGVQGVAATRYLARRGACVSVVEQAAASKFGSLIEELSQFSNIAWYWQGEVPSVWTSVEAVLLSPGVPYDLPALQKIRDLGVPTIAALDLAARLTEIPMLAVTGSAGKSTTASLVGAMLHASGWPTFVGENLGTPLFVALDQEAKYQRLVLECSSFQLEACSHLRPCVAVLTNLGENHLDRHKTMENYAACKSRLFQFLPATSWVVARANDPWAERVIAGTPASVVYFYGQGEAQQGAMSLGPDLVLRHPQWGEERIPWSSLRLRGQHNRENAMAAALASRLAGATATGIQQGMDNFRGLPHRLEDVGLVRGVRYFNDSKATTPTAAVRSMQAFAYTGEPLHVMLGGRAKGTRFHELNEALGTGVKRLYLFGEAATTIAEDIRVNVPVSLFSTLHEALEAAQKNADTGDVVLLSPACASFDQFSNFEERGKYFCQWVLRSGENSHV